MLRDNEEKFKGLFNNKGCQGEGVENSNKSKGLKNEFIRNFH